MDNLHVKRIDIENLVSYVLSVCNKLYSAKLFSKFCTFLIFNGECSMF
jgi:hypothetical protein